MRGALPNWSAASGTAPLYYQWQKGTNNIYVNATDSGDVSGVTTNTLTFSAVAADDNADYRVIVTNSVGSATSQLATITVLFTDTSAPAMAALNPPASASLNALTPIQLAFTKNVFGVEAEDLLSNGLPAGSVSGSGSNYVFTFPQPPPGTVLVY